MKIIHMSGKRKQAIARATLKQGTGQVRINKVALEVFQPRLARDKIGEPLVLAGTVAHDVDIDIITHGGGFMSQAEAGRLALAKALAKYDKKLESLFLSY
ncbi:MAG: 30S ribosomal protein S9, partial [Nanoarchaeota archaeon]|nr:30S ribosomal protein S9 [Nanoarchaeota archaeon]